MDSKHIKRLINGKLVRHYGLELEKASRNQLYHATALVVRDLLMEKRVKTQEEIERQNAKRVCYFSMEFLLGRSLQNNVFNLGLTKEFNEVLEQAGTSLTELYEKEAVRLGQDRALEGMAEGFKGGSVEISPDTAKRQEILGTCVTDQTSEMCPVWFLTWRKGQRLAYAVINGETGKLFAEIPVDIKAFMIRTLLIAAVLFVIFTLFAPLILPYTAAAISSVMALIVQLIYRHEMRELYDREKNLNNLGAFSNAPETEVRKVMKQREKRGLKLAGCIIPFIAFLNFIVVSCFLNDGKTGALICTFVVSFCGIIVWLMSLKTGFGIKEKDMLLGITLPVIAQLAAFAVVAAKPVPDWPYYIAAGGGLAATLLTALSMLFRYNELCTRGVPDFHDRKGGAKYEAG